MKAQNNINVKNHPIIGEIVKFKRQMAEFAKSEQMLCQEMSIEEVVTLLEAQAAEEPEEELSEADVRHEERKEETGDEFYERVKAQKTLKRDVLKSKKNLQQVDMSDMPMANGGKRNISYSIRKNKGLTPSRPKEVRNPRVKRRTKFESASRKLKSTKRINDPKQAGAQREYYSGEATGISKSLSRSVKFNY